MPITLRSIYSRELGKSGAYIILNLIRSAIIISLFWMFFLFRNCMRLFSVYNCPVKASSSTRVRGCNKNEGAAMRLDIRLELRSGRWVFFAVIRSIDISRPTIDISLRYIRIGNISQTSSVQSCHQRFWVFFFLKRFIGFDITNDIRQCRYRTRLFDSFCSFRSIIIIRMNDQSKTTVIKPLYQIWCDHVRNLQAREIFKLTLFFEQKTRLYWLWVIS